MDRGDRQQVHRKIMHSLFGTGAAKTCTAAAEFTALLQAGLTVSRDRAGALFSAHLPLVLPVALSSSRPGRSTRRGVTERREP
jgi:hypothetical protein